MDKKILWPLVIIGYSIIIAILLLTEVVSIQIGAALNTAGFIVIVGLMKMKSGKKQAD